MRSLGWMDDARCVEIGGDEWFPEVGIALDAKRICNGDPRRGTAPCPVRSECLQWAIDADPMPGVYGGMGERERRGLRKGVAA